MSWSHNFKTDTVSYQELFDLMPYPLIVLKPDSPAFTIIEVNNKYLEGTKTDRDKIVGRSLFDLYKEYNREAGYDRDLIIEHFNELIKTRAPELQRIVRWDIPIPGTDQMQVKYWRMVITPILNESGEVVQILNAPVDVTENILLEKKAHKATKEAEFQKRYLHDIFLQAPIGVGVYRGPEFIVELVNPSLGEFLGRDYRELLGKPFFEVVDEAAGMGWEKIIHQVLYTNEPFVGFEHPVKLLKKGKMETRYCTFIVYPFYESEGKSSGVIKISIDVTEYVQIKQELKANEERFAIAVESANLCVWDMNLKEDKVITLTKIDLPGFPDPGVVWTLERCLQFVVPEDVPLVVEALADAKRTGKFYASFRVQADDVVSWVEATGRVFGDPTHIIGTTQDITGRVELDRRKNDMITTISHELKTPITSIKAITQVLTQKFAKSSDRPTYNMLEKMSNQVIRLTGLIHDLLDVSVIERCRLQLHKKDFLFYDLIEDAVSEIQGTTSSHEIIIEGEKPIPCHSDKERLHQVLTNLLTNAIKYSPGKDKVLISATSRAKEVTCCIRDFGIGIPKEKQKYVFDQFFRVIGERNYAFQGIGLGLYISAEIVKRLGGKIWLESKPNEGSTFCFSVPAVKE